MTRQSTREKNTNLATVPANEVVREDLANENPTKLSKIKFLTTVSRPSRAVPPCIHGYHHRR